MTVGEKVEWLGQMGQQVLIQYRFKVVFLFRAFALEIFLLHKVLKKPQIN